MDVFFPKNVKEAVDLLAKYRGQARAVAGGTDVLVDYEFKSGEPRYLVSLSRLSDLEYISSSVEGCKIGSVNCNKCIGKSSYVNYTPRYIKMFEKADMKYMTECLIKGMEKGVQIHSDRGQISLESIRSVRGILGKSIASTTIPTVESKLPRRKDLASDLAEHAKPWYACELSSPSYEVKSLS